MSIIDQWANGPRPCLAASWCPFGGGLVDWSAARSRYSSPEKCSAKKAYDNILSKSFFFSSPVFFFCLTMQLPILVGPPFYSLRAASLVPSLWIRRKRAAPSTFRSIKRPTADPGPNLIRLPIVHRLMEEENSFYFRLIFSCLW